MALRESGVCITRETGIPAALDIPIHTVRGHWGEVRGSSSNNKD